MPAAARLASMMILVALLAACGGGAAPASTGSASSAASGSGPAPGAKIKDTLTVAIPINVETFDPNITRSTVTSSVTGLVFETLLKRDAETMKLEPWLAASYKSVDPTTWEFKLRTGVKFTNGEEFNAEAVKFSLDRGLEKDLNSSAKSYLQGIYKETTIVDPTTVRITTTLPDPLLPSRLAPEPVSMMAPKYYKEHDLKYVNDKPVGTGPYRLAEWVVGDRAVLELNPDYWGAKPPTKRIVWRTVPDATTRVAALQRGEVDAVTNLEVPLIPTVEKSPSLRVYSELGSFTQKFLINTRKPGPLQDKRVRQALNYAVNKEELSKTIYAGHGQIERSVIASQVTGYAAQQPYEYNPDKAKQLLTEANFPKDTVFDLTVPTARTPGAEEVTKALGGYLDKVGVKTRVQTAEFAVFNRKAAAYEYEGIIYYAFSNLLWEPDQIFGYFLKEGGRWNYFLAEGAEREAILNARKEFDEAKRKEYQAQAQKLLWDEAPWLFLYQFDEIYGLTKNVQGFKMSADQITHVEKAYVNG